MGPAEAATAAAQAAWQAYAATAVEPLKQVLAGPLAGASTLPFYEPLVTSLAIFPSAAAAALVGKAALERLLVPVLKSSSSSPSLNSQQYSNGRKLGGGSYGAVYEGFRGDEDEPSFVIKETSARNEIIDGNVANFGESELFINQKLMLCGQAGSMAPFVGHYYYGGDLCLVYKNEGELTLDKALKGGFPWNVEEALTGRESDEQTLERQAVLIRKVASQIFGALANIHGWNVVHRDVKGANLVLAERQRRFKLIDFGAAVDTVSRTNYNAKLQVFDPDFGPPEADLWKSSGGQEGGFVIGTAGKFDVFCAGLLVMQMCFPALRSASAIKNFKKALYAEDYDLSAWREKATGFRGYEDGIEILDTYGGWKLLEGCLREEPGERISASAAAASGFCRA
eukprot:1317742-Prymnesium_polylepis.1